MDTAETAATQELPKLPNRRFEDLPDGAFTYFFPYDIPAHGENVRSLTFREPTGADIVSMGNPMRLNLTVDEAKMEATMSALAAVPPSTIKKLKSRDWVAIQMELVARFFYPPTLMGTGT